MDVTVAAATFGLILPAELPDKTFVATLVLGTRYRPLPVWVGVTLAFAVQCAVAVTAGGLLAQLPRRPVLAVSALLFATGSWLLMRDEKSEVAEGETVAASAPPRTRRVVLTSFAVLFAAEWGDLSQLLTAALTARYDDPLGVFAGSWLALGLIAALAVVAGRSLLAWLPLQLVRRLAGALFGLLAVVTGLEAVGVHL
jgi:putative Ca2+/H+ antiporter (TMEM165/GDT1 family)